LSQATKVVAILTANRALSSLIAMVLAGRRTLRVRRFETTDDLVTYMRIAPIDLLVCDYDLETTDAEALARSLRTNPVIATRAFHIIALSRQVTPEMKDGAKRAGIGEVIVKPMSPRYLLERVEARLGGHVPLVAAEGGYTGPGQRSRLPLRDRHAPQVERRADNVIPLFGRTRPARPDFVPSEPA
jgi:two-component system, OmpR family, phosphate regulon response regulator PhoB